MGWDGKVVASGFHLFDLRQLISIVDLNLGNRSVANDVENVLRTDRVVSPGLLNVILLVELGRPPDVSPARSPAALSGSGPYSKMANAVASATRWTFESSFLL